MKSGKQSQEAVLERSIKNCFHVDNVLIQMHQVFRTTHQLYP